MQNTDIKTNRMIGRWTLDIVEAKFGLSAGDVCRKGRGSTLQTMARQVAGYLLTTRLGLTYVETGKLVNQHDSTVAHNVRRVETMREDPALNAQICALEKAVDSLCGAAMCGVAT